MNSFKENGVAEWGGCKKKRRRKKKGAKKVRRSAQEVRIIPPFRTHQKEIFVSLIVSFCIECAGFSCFKKYLNIFLCHAMSKVVYFIQGSVSVFLLSQIQSFFFKKKRTKNFLVHKKKRPLSNYTTLFFCVSTPNTEQCLSWTLRHLGESSP